MTRHDRPLDVLQPSDEVEQPAPPPTSRRSVLGLATAVGAAGLVAACGGGGDSSSPAASTSSGTTSQSAAGSSPPADPGGEVLTKTSDVPVGGGVILSDAKVVVTQPTAGEFKAFSSTCTHMSCQVNSVSGERIGCMCHGSSFSIADGSPEGGPATRPLPEVGVTVEGDSVIRS